MLSDLRAWLAPQAIFADADAKSLWSDPHIAARMLDHHLDDTTPLASRPAAGIDAITDWLDARLDLDGKHITDLGCGPGLYAQRFVAKGARVTGIDLSSPAIAYARQHTGLGATFLVADYVACNLPTSNIVVSIYCDVCAIAPNSRRQLFRRIFDCLEPGGHFVVEVFADTVFDPDGADTIIAENLDDGFWAPAPYVGGKQICPYPDSKTSLNRYLIVEPDRTRIFNSWTQFFSPSLMTDELASAGFAVSPPISALTGADWHPNEIVFFLIASK